MREFFAKDVSETELIGERLGKVLKSDDVVFLTGELGAGKTAFTRGIARGMGITSTVKSPTFTIVREYEGRLFHFDLYRIKSEEELFDIDFESYLSRGTCVIEWPDAAREITDCTVHADIVYKGDGRSITLNRDI
ncbi:MAG: tRNA (adenosine(37)-N6)-threonylcarbamoyltransferase complex ATPase subunit type 1 TsaE [Christensenellaceae bacterium]|nr:tRNA (adenosine(37)-N6)-threonylcarbamoyltransferase complex ATPase subunit type 1 TsaE [Christensenellaceae bacterium]